MNDPLVLEFSSQLKAIAKDLSFLGHPRFPVKSLLKIFPEHNNFINNLEDVSTPYGVDLVQKRQAIDQLLKDLAKSNLDQNLKLIFTKRLEDYHLLTSMIEHFGSIFFYEKCTQIYGSSKTKLNQDAFYYFTDTIADFCKNDEAEKTLHGEVALSYLKNKMLETFDEKDFDIKASTSLLSDSSAGRKSLKLNSNKLYSENDLNIFLVHEGWAHLGTSINGRLQNEHPWLSTWAPRTTFLQEGLAILTELITGQMTKERWNKVLMRHLATTMAEKGSNIKDVYGYLKHQGFEELDAFKISLRVFRGVPLDGGMSFTKELLYLHGLLELLNYIHLHSVDFKTLWIGKVSFEEHLTLIKNWDQMHLEVKYFPQELNSKFAKEKLERLTQLSFSLFRHDF